MGIVAATGKYKAEWFLCFMGLENYPAFRPGGRLTNYLQNYNLSKKAFNDLTTYIENAAENVEELGNKHSDIYSLQGKYEMLLKLTKTNLIALPQET